MTREEMLEKVTQARELVEEAQAECGEVAGELERDWNWMFLHGYLAAAWDLLKSAETELGDEDAPENYPNPV